MINGVLDARPHFQFLPYLFAICYEYSVAAVGARFLGLRQNSSETARSGGSGRGCSRAWSNNRSLRWQCGSAAVYAFLGSLADDDDFVRG